MVCSSKNEEKVMNIRIKQVDSTNFSVAQKIVYKCAAFLKLHSL